MNDFTSFIDDTPLWSAPFGLKLLDTLILKKNINVLDIGCGEGFPTIEMAARFGKSSRFFGLDFLAQPLKRMVYKKNTYQLPGVHAVQGAAEALPFQDNFFDLVTSNNGLNNIRNLKQALKDLRRAMKTGAQLVNAMNTDQTMQEFYTLFEKILIKESQFTAVKNMKDQIRQKRPSQMEWESFLTAAGFHIHQVFHDAFTMKFVDGTTLLNHYLIQQFFLPGWKQLVDPKKRIDLFNIIESRLNNMAIQKGHVCLTIPFMVMDCRAE